MGGTESKGREENGEDMESMTSALAKGVITGVAILALGVAILALCVAVVSLMGDSSKSREEETMEDPVGERKTMKAPGRDGERMPRDNFQRDARAYFRKLHSDERKEKSLANK